MGAEITQAQRVRAFNRFYTNVLRLLDRHYLFDYSLTEARILFELQQGADGANALRARLGIDKSYLSRILKRFEKRGLLSRTVCPEDNRCALLALTPKGLDTTGAMIRRSNEQVNALLAPLTPADRDRLCAAMDVITETLGAAGERERK